MVCRCLAVILDSIVVSIPDCHAGDRGSIPRRGDNTFSVLRRLLVKGIIPRKYPPFACNYAIFTQAVNYSFDHPWPRELSFIARAC